MKLRTKKLAAFTLLESLLVLSLTCLLILSLSGTVSSVFEQVEEKLFFLSFENLYRDTQKLAASKQESMFLQIGQHSISNGITEIALPQTVTVSKSYQIKFDQAGGNSSLAKISFQTRESEISYQLYLGSGNYKKSESSSLHSP